MCSLTFISGCLCGCGPGKLLWEGMTFMDSYLTEMITPSPPHTTDISPGKGGGNRHTHMCPPPPIVAFFLKKKSFIHVKHVLHKT